MGRFVYVPIHEWLIFMGVNAGKYTVRPHGLYSILPSILVAVLQIGEMRLKGFSLLLSCDLF